MNNNIPLSPTPLQFEFRGYSVWLEVQDETLTKALAHASAQLHVQTIPQAHVTVLYGIMVNEEEEEQALRQHFQTLATNVFATGGWPGGPFTVQDVTSHTQDDDDFSFGWTELTLHNDNLEHRRMVEDIQEHFLGQEQQPWLPHVSLVYENLAPDTIGRQALKESLLQSFPNLMTTPILVTHISLWKTMGTMQKWERLETIPLVDFLKSRSLVGQSMIDGGMVGTG